MTIFTNTNLCASHTWLERTYPLRRPKKRPLTRTVFVPVEYGPSRIKKRESICSSKRKRKRKQQCLPSHSSCGTVYTVVAVISKDILDLVFVFLGFDN